MESRLESCVVRARDSRVRFWRLTSPFVNLIPSKQKLVCETACSLCVVPSYELACSWKKQSEAAKEIENETRIYAMSL